jgi:tetratricopeptide (TPR) repeat protein
VKKTQDLAGEVNKILDAQMPSASDEAAQGKLRWFRVRTNLLAADLAKHDRGAERNKSLERALGLLANFEKDVEGVANANNLLGEALFIRVNALMSLKRSDEALANLGKFLETRSGDDGIRIVYEMLESLNKEFQQAEQNKNQGRMAELAGHRAKVSGYLVDRVTRSTNPEVKKLEGKYRMFEAGALQQAAVLEKDEKKREGYLEQAMGIFEEARKTSPGDKGIELNIALVNYDLGKYAEAQPVLVRYLTEGWLGKPRVAVSGPEGERMVDNNQYWDAMYRLLRCNVALANAGAAGYDAAKLMEETKLKLKQLYIQWGTPGGARWGEKFDVLRKEIMAEWEAPKV